MPQPSTPWNKSSSEWECPSCGAFCDLAQSACWSCEEVDPELNNEDDENVDIDGGSEPGEHGTKP